MLTDDYNEELEWREEWTPNTPFLSTQAGDITQKSLFPGRVLSGLQKSAVKFSLECQVKFLGYKRLDFISFYWLFILSRELDVVYLTISLNESKKLSKLWKPEECSCKMCKTYIAQVGFIWFYIHIKFILIKNKPCFSYFATKDCIKAEYFRTTVNILI